MIYIQLECCIMIKTCSARCINVHILLIDGIKYTRLLIIRIHARPYH